jgi:hypothetical protein
MAIGRHKVDRAIVVEVCRDLRLKTTTEHRPAVRPAAAKKSHDSSLDDMRDEDDNTSRTPAGVGTRGFPRPRQTRTMTE